MNPPSESALRHSSRLFGLISVTVLALLAFAGCKKTIAVTSIRLDKTSLTLTEGESANLTATVSPSDATVGTYSWISSDPSVASVNSGVVKALKAGSATITVTTTDGGKSASCSVTVKSAKISVTGVTLDQTSLELVEGKTATLKATVAPSNATDPSVSWSSSDKGVATVDSNGGIIAVKAGSAIITVTTTDGGKTASCAVTVKPAKISVTGVALDKTSASLLVGQTQQLKATVTPDNATDKSVTWSSSNANIASVDKSGLVTAQKPGSATITVVTTDGSKMATCDFTITQPVSGVSLDKSTLTLTEGDQATLTATVSPEDASNKEISWSTSDASIVSLDQTGNVLTVKATAVKEGTAKITVTTKDGGKTAECAVTVSKKIINVTGVTLDKTSASLLVGQTQQLKATVIPDNATDKSVSWSSSNANIASVDNAGLVTAQKPGSATITVVTTDGSKMATCDFTITQPVSGVSLDKTTLTMTEGDNATLTATVSPEDASNKEVSWSTSDAGIVSLDQTGNVLTVKATAVKEGSAKVTVTTKDGNKTAECAVTVNKKIIHVTDITLNKTSDTLIVDETLQLAATVKPDDATDKSFTWSSSKPSVASVDANGLVTAVAVGYATITATTTDGSHLASCDLKVKEMGINIPDANFKKYLVRNFDSNGDGEISETEASKVESISCISKDISSLAGIEYFTSLKYLNCSGNHLTGLDASLMADNVTLYCGNQTDADGKETWLSLTLRLAQSKQWQWAKGSGDNVRVSVTYKDAETNVINIPDANFRKYILDKYCGGASIITLDNVIGIESLSVSQLDIVSLSGIEYFASLKTLNVYGNLLTTLDLSKNTALTILDCSSNKLAELDLSTNTLLTYVHCNENQLTSLNVSGCTDLTNLACFNNRLTMLDLTDNTALQYLSCSNNPLVSLDLSNNKELLSLEVLGSTLSSLDVSNHTKLYDLLCGSNLTSLNVSGCTALSDLKCNNNKLTSLKVSNCPALTTLACENNYLTALDLSGCTALESVDCMNNHKLASINLIGCTALKTFICNDCLFSSLDVSYATALEELYCYGNKLTSLDLSRNMALKDVNCSANALTVLNVSNNTLTRLSCNNNKITALDVSKNISLEYFSCANNGLTAIDISKNAALTHFDCQSNQILNLDVSKNVALESLFCRGNGIATLDVSKNTALTDIDCGYNKIASLDVRNCTALTEVWCSNNVITALDISKNTSLSLLECDYNRLTTLDATTMAEQGKFSLYCGYQKDSGNNIITMSLTLLTAQKTRWEFLAGAAMNGYVSVTYK